mmetsp:Transcript_115777/g.368136  ORF Transcript_115777/g.368136 Transcript_115777/m.368136 type:complete len:216 (+) Transcript_115777:857-1504(+)
MDQEVVPVDVQHLREARVHQGNERELVTLSLGTSGHLVEVPEDDLARLPQLPPHARRRQRGIAVVPELDGQSAASAAELCDGQQRIHRVGVRADARLVAQPSHGEHAPAAALARPGRRQAVHDGAPLGALLGHLEPQAPLSGRGGLDIGGGKASTAAQRGEPARDRRRLQGLSGRCFQYIQARRQQCMLPRSHRRAHSRPPPPKAQGDLHGSSIA